MSAKENKRIVERFIDRVVTGRDVQSVDACCGEDVVMRVPNGVAYGRSGVRKLLSDWFSAVPDGRFSQEYCIAEGEFVACRTMLRGTFAGNYRGVSANGRKVALPQLWMFRLAEDLIREIEVTYDMGLLHAQLGTLLPSVIEK